MNAPWANDSYGYHRPKGSSVERLANARLRLLEVTRLLFRIAPADYAGNGASRPKPEVWERVPFAAKLKSVDEAPEPLRGAMLEALKPPDAIRWLIFGPIQRTAGKVSPASLLAILGHEWIVVVCGEDVQPQVHRCDFADTLLVEITDVLLYGRLRVDFVNDGRVQSVAILFNTVMFELYHEAVQILLSGMGGDHQTAIDGNSKVCATLKVLPLKFQNGILRYLPVGQHVLEFVYWPSTLGRQLMIFWRELAPQGVLVLTNRYILFISEVKAWWRGKSTADAKYGYVVTYCPLSRVQAMRLTERDSLDAINVDVCADQLGEKLKIGFPREKKAAVAAFVELAISSPAFFESIPKVRGDPAPSKI
jgi:hypothetical protein